MAFYLRKYYTAVRMPKRRRLATAQPAAEERKQIMTGLTRSESGLHRWDPFKELEDMQNRLSSLFGRAPVRKGDGEENITVAEWAPLVDITEDEKEYLITAELPQV